MEQERARTRGQSTGKTGGGEERWGGGDGWQTMEQQGCVRRDGWLAGEFARGLWDVGDGRGGGCVGAMHGASGQSSQPGGRGAEATAIRERDSGSTSAVRFASPARAGGGGIAARVCWEAGARRSPAAASLGMLARAGGWVGVEFQPGRRDEEIKKGAEAQAAPSLFGTRLAATGRSPGERRWPSVGVVRAAIRLARRALTPATSCARIGRGWRAVVRAERGRSRRGPSGSGCGEATCRGSCTSGVQGSRGAVTGGGSRLVRRVLSGGDIATRAR